MKQTMKQRNENMWKRKRGTIMEILFLIVALFIISIVFPIARTVFGDVNESLSDNFGGNATEIMTDTSSTFDVLDGMILFVVVTLGMGGVYLAYKVKMTPIFWIFAVILLGFIVLVATIFSNAQNTYAGEDTIAEGASFFVNTNFIMSNLVTFVIGFGFLIIIAMYIKLKGGGE